MDQKLEPSPASTQNANHQLIYRDQHLAVVHGRGAATKGLFFVFGPVGSHDPENPWGAIAFTKQDIEAYFFVPLAPNWYPQDSVEKAWLVIQKDIKRGRPRIAYGVSGGGYAVLRYGKLLGAHYIAAFSPQVSIAPNDVSAFDTRYEKYYVESLHASMRIRKTHLTGLKGAIFFDPYHGQDRIHANQICVFNPKLQAVRCNGSNHRTIRVFTESGNSAELIRTFLSAASGAIVSYQSLYRASRRRSASYLLGMSAIIRKKSKHKRASWVIQYDLLACSYVDDVAAQIRITSHYLALQDHNQADSWIAKVEQNKRKKQHLPTIARLYEKRGDLEKALITYSEHCTLHRTDVDSWCRLSALLLKAGRVKAAVETLSKINLGAAQLDVGILTRYAKLKARLEMPTEALSVLKAYEQRFGQDAEYRKLLSTMQAQTLRG